MAYKNKYVCIHGHFYQPPRENAWLEAVEQQESAKPWHDWNARINFECYAPNAAARILDERGWIVKIRNNYNRISFNFGPTLLSWMEQNDAEAYSLLQKADLQSAKRFGGHGSALAQVHSHIIMPLANYRDKVTQVCWGVKDFEHRFKRYPEGIWLAETAVNTETLEVLAAQGIQYTILAPRQAKAIRRIGTNDWQNVNAESIDTRKPYWCNLPSGRKIALYFYNGGVAQQVAFNGVLNSGKAFATSMVSIFDGNDDPQLAHTATDGESYGHHHRFGEMALADCLNSIEDSDIAKLTNYGQYLELHPPSYEAQIHENSSWSCVHGIERWRSDCGCNSGGNNTHQRWRKPLRAALDWLRDQLIPFFEKNSVRFLRDPWAARNDYIEVMLDRSDAKIAAFFKKHVLRSLAPMEEVMVLRLLEMQRHALLMYTSCGWFFDEISGIETNQILQYALRAMDYAQDIAGLSLHNEFSKRLAEAPSNIYENGAVAYHKNVMPTRVNLERVAMHFAVASVFENDPESLNFFNYSISKEFFEKIEAGTPRLVLGRVNIRSQLTRAEKTFSFAVLYLGQQHIIGNISGTMTRNNFDEMSKRTSKAFSNASIGEVIGILQEYFGPEKFTLSSLFMDEKIAIIRDITSQNLQLAEANFRNVFNDNYQLMTALQESSLPIPDAWKNIASYVLNTDLHQYFERGADTKTLIRITEDLKRWKVSVSDEEHVRHAASERIFNEISGIQMEENSLPRVVWLCDMLEIIYKMELKPDIWRSQNVFYLLTKGYRKGDWVFINDAWKGTFVRLAALLKVKLEV
jgi:alpha-amylase/alpha-mannosidase (GH57 family)